MKDLKTASEELDQALSRLENSVDALCEKNRMSRIIHAEAEALRRDRAQLAMDLDASRAREQELEALADEASQALGTAIAEVRAAMAATSTEH
ncbi:DUF4164 family protein [Ponticaulis profundi]|uniref:DUF4164 family protein n=1 Tax=Ponticaulis profundi TaxID=2665222 RepID=A0ABW1SCM4_9PROT|tara:strand:+ start:352 stop:630 length:279 start_codon:yes stop_codon:yes gene_type:complete